MTLFFTAVDALRQFMPERARVHGVIRHGGAAPNVVPDFTQADVLVRDITAERTLALVERVEACAHGAAMCTGTTASLEQTAPLYTERKNNHAMAERVAGYLEAQGLDRLGDQAFLSAVRHEFHTSRPDVPEDEPD